jgi:drug/metabolite transporter (DMT)-like permease
LTNKSLHRPVLGALLKLISVALLIIMSTCIKLLGKDIPIGETIFVRGVMAILVLGLIAHRTTGLHVLKTGNWRRHALRSLAGTASMFCLFASLTMIPLADVTAINFASPIFITVLAMLLLKERIHAFRWAALIIGLTGVVIMIAPQLSLQHGTSIGWLLALGGALFGAVAITTLRSMSHSEPAITITFYFLVTAMSCALLTSLLGWVKPDLRQATWILMAALCGVLGQLAMTTAYRYAEASTIAPLDYTAMIMSVAIGYLVFTEVPTTSIWLGSVLVIVAGLVIIWREYRLHKHITTPR